MSFTNPPAMPPLPPDPPKRPGFWSAWSVRKRAAAIVGSVVVASGVYGVIAAAQGGDERVDVSAAEDLANGADEAGEAVQGCADSWNENNPHKGNVASIATAAQQSGTPTAYVNVGFSDLFPDRCMVTVANPSTLYAQQYLQDPGNGWSGVPAWTGTASQIDSSNLPWNGRMAQDGTVIIR
ncbi:hypothetical protein [Streptomyces sp. NPDC050507]|uniref:hypothetical protein n=1 Tax=Streptomyces sp. NPDC050507 TaxID=3365619 RepID=UPI00378C22B2